MSKERASTEMSALQALIRKNLQQVQSRIEAAAQRVGRSSREVRLVAVTKSMQDCVIPILLDLGITDFGENRTPQLVERATQWGASSWNGASMTSTKANTPLPTWHMVGHVQRNKVKTILSAAALIHSVDTLRLAEEIEKQSAKLNRQTSVLFQINASHEPQKYGASVAAASHLIEQIKPLNHVRVRGLMAMAEAHADEETIRNSFHRVRELYEEIIRTKLYDREFLELSLGMSDDYEIAIECGATMIRIGSAIFEGCEAYKRKDDTNDDTTEREEPDDT